MGCPESDEEAIEETEETLETFVIGKDGDGLSAGSEPTADSAEGKQKPTRRASRFRRAQNSVMRFRNCVLDEQQADFVMHDEDVPQQVGTEDTAVNVRGSRLPALSGLVHT